MTWNYKFRFPFYCQHIFSKYHDHRSMSGFIFSRTKSCVQICSVSLCKYSRIKLRFIAFSFTYSLSVFVMYISCDPNI